MSFFLFGLVGAFLSPLLLLCFRFSESIGFGLVGGKKYKILIL